MKKIIVEETECLNISTIIWHIKYDKTMSCSPFGDTLAKLSQKSYSTKFVGFPYLRLRFTTTNCNFGGIRYWFLCPACGKRVGKLYVTLSADEFRCRQCHKLTYQLCQTHNQRVASLLKYFKRAEKMQQAETVTPVIKGMYRTRRGFRLLQKVYYKWDKPRPLSFLERRNREEAAYGKYIKPLFGLLDFPSVV